MASIAVFVGLLCAVGVPRENGLHFLNGTKIVSTMINGERKIRVFAFSHSFRQEVRQIQAEHGHLRVAQPGYAKFGGDGWSVVVQENPYHDGRPNRLVLYTGVSWQDKTAHWVSETIFRPLGFKKIL